MKMTDKDVVYLPETHPVSAHLHLSTLSAVYQKQPLMYIKHMSGRISV